MTTFLLGWRHPHVWEGAPLVPCKWSPRQHDKDVVNSNQVVCFISCQGLCAHIKWLYTEFQFTATNFVSMAAKLSDLVDETSGAILQMEGHMDVPPQNVKDLKEPEALDSSPSHSPSWFPAKRLPSSHPNMKHCLEICVTLTEELGAVPSPSHSWTAPLMEDMLHNARPRLTKAVVIGPGRAVLFHGRHSMGEGLTVEEARDTTFLLTGTGTWVVKLAYLTADPMTIQEGRRAIAQVITDCWVKVRGLGHPHVNPLAQQSFQFDPQEVIFWRMCLGMVVLIFNHHLISPQEAKNVTDVRETKGLHHIGSPHLPQTMGSRVMGVHYQQLPWCHLGLTGQMDPDVPEEVDGIERMEFMWR